MRALSGSMAGLMLATSCTGCFSTWDVSPKELTRLSGYRAPQPMPIVDNDGKEIQFDQRTELRFLSPGGDEQEKAKFSSINVEGTTLTGVTSADKRTVSIDLSKVGEVEARKFSIGKTIAAGIGIPAGVTLTTAVIFVVAASRASRMGSGASGP